MKTLLITLLALSITFFSCKKEDAIKADYRISINESFQLNLASNPSTGYSWKWSNKQSVSKVDTFSCRYIPDIPILDGSGGKEIWNFKGLKSGIDTVILEYCRSWDLTSTINTKKIVVKIE